MAYSSPTGTAESAEPAQGSHEQAEAELDLRVLAEKVYRLLKEEARLERERLGQRHTW
jgi:hypothetical protein